MSQVSFFDILIIGDLAVRGNFVFCLIIVVVFIGLGRAYTLWWGGGGVVGTGVGNHMFGGSWPLKTPFKDFNLAILGLGWIKWLKDGAGKCLYVMKLFLTISFLGSILLVKLEYPYIQYAWMSIMKKKQNSGQNGKVEKMVVLVKTFDHCHHKFQLFQLSYKIVKEFETEI